MKQGLRKLEEIMIRSISMPLLLRWYDRNQRSLPWRETRDPYRIWLSEIMLQQTQVQTVLPYYRAFTERFPSVEAMAVAPVEDVLALWSGLGYYRRARHMHAAAVRVSEMGGRFPESSKELQKLPGIGPYTAAAIASIAFDEAVPVLDGNVERVLCRILALEGDPKKPAIRRRLQAVAGSSIDPHRPGDCNQAMMELGAIVCRPKRPDCGACPLKMECRAFEAGEVERFPVPRQRRKVEKIHWSVAVVHDRRGRVLLFRRPRSRNVMGGMWELPTIEARESIAESERALGREYGGTWTLGEKIGEFRHAITFRSIRGEVYRAEVEHGDEVREGVEAAWAGPRDRSRFAVSSMVEKALELCGGDAKRGN